jgi:hypothetical protein
MMVAEVEAQFDERHLPARSLESWQEFIAIMQPGDELWWFCSPETSWKHLAGRAGFAIVRDGEIVARRVMQLN